MRIGASGRQGLIKFRSISGSWGRGWRRLGHRALVLCALWFAALACALPGPRATAADTGLAGQVLVAAPRLSDTNFARTVIVLIEHDETGGWGLIVNRPAGEISLRELTEELGAAAPAVDGTIPLHQGGPVEPQRGFILHTPDYSGEATLPIADVAAVSVDLGVIEALARGEGPRAARALFGYAGWGAGQLENEIARGDWEVRRADLELLFGRDNATKWRRALTGEDII